MKFSTSSVVAACLMLLWVAHAQDDTVEACKDAWAHSEKSICTEPAGAQYPGWTNGRFGTSSCNECGCPACPTDPPSPQNAPTAPPVPAPVPLPQKCIGISGKWSGDPHFQTFDGLKFDCQGEGEFHVLKSLDSELEIQGRFIRFRTEKRPTVTKSMAFKTGDGEPVIQVTTPNSPENGSCAPHVHAAKILTDIPIGGAMIDDSVQIAHHVEKKGKYLLEGFVIYYHNSGVQATVLAKKSSANGCVLSVKVCFPYTWPRTHERFVGLLGTPDKDKTNDWMKFDGTPVEVPTKKKDLKFKKSYDWCVEEFCVKSEEKSLFAYESGESYNGFNKCYQGEDIETEQCVDNPDANVLEVCGANDLECLVDGCVGGAEEAQNFLETEADLASSNCGKEIYFENFDGPEASSWGHLAQGNLDSKFLLLGREHGDSFEKEIPVPSGADKVVVEFFFLEVGKWEGDKPNKEYHDHVLMKIGDTEIDITEDQGFDKKQNTDEERGGVKEGISWKRYPVTDYNEDFGIQWDWVKTENRLSDQMHKMEVSIPQSHFESGKLKFKFVVTIGGGWDDERGGVDDFRVTAYGLACDIPKVNGDDGIEYDRACGEEIINENFDSVQSHSWGTIETSSGRSYLKMDKFSPEVIVSDSTFPADTDVVAIDFLAFKLGDWVGECKNAVGNCGASKITAKVGNTAIDIKLDSFAQGGGVSTSGTVDGINWYRQVVTPGIIKVELHVPEAKYPGGAAAFDLLLLGNEDDLGVGIDNVRGLAYSNKCFVQTVRRELLSRVMQPSLALSTPWSRHLTTADADECTCMCPELLETPSANAGQAPASLVMNLYIASPGECNPEAPVVGSVTMTYESDGTISVTYDMADGYVMIESNVHIGEERLPVAESGDFLPASEFPYSGSLATSYKVHPLVCDFYLAAHAKVCGDFPLPSPTGSPTISPTAAPTGSPTAAPTAATSSPSASPTVASGHPSSSPTTGSPTRSPTAAPTVAPETPTASPTVTPETPAPTGGSAFGDPHIKTWSGHEYDFHGGCDLVFLDNPSFHDGLGMTIHVRTKIVTWWSYIETAVVRIGNETLEVTGGDHKQYFVNGVEGDQSVKDFKFSPLGLRVAVKHATAKQLKVRIDLLNADAIGFEVFKDFVRVNVKMIDMKWKKFEGSVGLMGRYPHGEAVGRDGKTIFTDMNAFGQEWQVQESEPKLFRIVSGPQHPTKCSMPSQVPTEEEARRRLGESVITREDAELACASVPANSIKDCIFDVLASLDLDMAGSYYM